MRRIAFTSRDGSILAIGELQEAIRLISESNLLYPHLLLGNIYHELGENKLAFAAYRGALLEVGKCQYRELLTLALEATGTPEDVVTAYRAAIRESPGTRIFTSV